MSDSISEGAANDEIKLSCRNLWKIYGPEPESFFIDSSGAVADTSGHIEQIRSAGHIAAACDVSFDVREGEIFIIMGLSGSGKSTVVRCLSRLVEPTAGEVLFDGDDLLKVSKAELIDIRRHKMGMVFQHFALLPHLTVLGNVAFPLEVQGVARAVREKRALEIIELVGLQGREAYYPRELSGGQQQRVALARTIVIEPRVLLLDEPLSNLDARLRLTMRGEIKRLQEDLGITSIYVTHDQVEAMTMADRIAVMSKGVLQAYDVPEALYDRPKTLFVAAFVGNPPMNFFDVDVMRDNGDFRARSDAIDLVVPHDRGEKAAAADGKVIMGIRPEDVDLVDEASPPAEGLTLTGRIEVVEPLGREDLVGVNVNDVEMRVLVDKTKNVRVGDTITLAVNTSKIQLFHPETEESLLWA